MGAFSDCTRYKRNRSIYLVTIEDLNKGISEILSRNIGSAYDVKFNDVKSMHRQYYKKRLIDKYISLVFTHDGKSKILWFNNN